MIKTDLNINENYLKELFRDSEEFLLIVDKNKNIIHMNKKAVSLFGNITLINKVEHLFSFDICILDNNKIFEYTPLKEALFSVETLKSEILFQIGDNEYKNLNLKSFKNNGNTIIILSDISDRIKNAENQKLIKDYEEKISKLEIENKGFIQLKERAQNLAIRTGLINRISNSIRDSLELQKIIEIALTEISETLGLNKAYFSCFNEEKESFVLKTSWNLREEEKENLKETPINQDLNIKQAYIDHKTTVSMVITDPQNNHIQPRLVVPVLYQDEILGIMVFYHVDNNRSWHEEEISLIEGITSQLVPAMNRAELFQDIIKQKIEIEEAIIKLKETQAQLVQSEKMASLGQLVAGVAHEVNTPLGAVNSNNSIFLKCIEKIKAKADDKELNEIIEIFEDTIKTNSEGINRINNLVKSLKNFARLDEAEYQEANINDGLKSTLMLINHEIKNRIELVEEYADLPRIKCYPNQLNQVFMNILVNACQSIDNKGQIKIKTEKNDANIIITISDTGKGISKDDLSRIFDPGFTTKGVGVGTGLGLSICYQIIEKHKGKISVESEEGQGSTFKIELPVV